MGNPARVAALAVLLPLLAVSGGAAQGISTPAKHAFMIDVSTDTVLLDKASDVPMPPASMSKLMTIYMVFDAIRRGTLKMEDELLVSTKAAKKGGSRMFMRPGERIRVNDLLRGIIVQSGNDACIVVAEALAGSEEEFAKLMTEQGRMLGLKHSTFTNSTGWPHPEHLMSARDLARLSMILIEKFPDLYAIFKEKTFTYNGIKQGNRNPLLYNDPSADGLKTGFTQASMYGLTASAIREGRRIILVLNGLKNSRIRREESARLMEWAFRSHRVYTLFKPGEEVVSAGVWLGAEPAVPLVVAGGLRLSLTLPHFRRMEVKVRTMEPVAAPIRKNDRIGTLFVSVPDRKIQEVPLLAGRDVKRMGVFGRLGATLSYLFWGGV